MSIPVGQPRTVSSTQAQPAPGLEGLGRGSRGPDVKTLQDALNARGAKLDVDGKFGPLTEAALKSFQAQTGCGGAGRVDAGTVAALQAPPSSKPTAPTTPSPTTPAPTSKPTAEVQTGARARCAAGEGAIRAQLGAVPTKAATPTATTSTAATPKTATATTASEPSVALNPEQVATALTAITAGKKQATEEKAVLGDVRSALQREVTQLETPSSSGARSAADDAVLMGRKGQLDAVTKAVEVNDLKLSGYDAAATAITDGVLTETEIKALTTVDSAVNNSEAAVVATMSAASELVDKGLKAGGRGSPTLGLKKTPQTPQTPAADTVTPPGETKIADGDVKMGQARIKTAVSGAQENLVAIANTRASVEGEIKGLKALGNPTVADQAVLQGRQAQLQVLDGAKANVELRIAGLEAASKAIGDGVLTASEAEGLAKAEGAIGAGEQALAAQANVAVELIRHGLAAGGRGSDVAL